MPTIAGSCLCGAVRYTSSAEPVLTAFCHCRDCQKSGGGGYSVNVAVPTESLTIEGETRAYRALGASGKPTVRRFCPQCGSPLFTDAEAFSGVSFVKGASLDDASWIEPNLHIWCASAQPWDPIPSGATCVVQNPAA